MLKPYGNYAAIMTNYASFLHQKCFSDSRGPILEESKHE